jgi:hypothetical protein
VLESVLIMFDDLQVNDFEKKESVDKEPIWRVLLHNDDVHTFDYVIDTIVKVCYPNSDVQNSFQSFCMALRLDFGLHKDVIPSMCFRDDGPAVRRDFANSQCRSGPHARFPRAAGCSHRDPQEGAPYHDGGGA